MCLGVVLNLKFNLILRYIFHHSTTRPSGFAHLPHDLVQQVVEALPKKLGVKNKMYKKEKTKYPFEFQGVHAREHLRDLVCVLGVDGEGQQEGSSRAQGESAHVPLCFSWPVGRSS